jgi:hypothetical protein
LSLPSNASTEVTFPALTNDNTANSLGISKCTAQFGAALVSCLCSRILRFLLNTPPCQSEKKDRRVAFFQHADLTK